MFRHIIYSTHPPGGQYIYEMHCRANLFAMPRGAAMESVCPESQLPTTLSNRVQLVVQHFPDAFANHKQAPRSQQRSHRGLHSNYRISEKPLTEMTLLCVGVFAAYLLVVIFITPQHATPTHPSLCLHYRPNGRLWTICFFALSLSLLLSNGLCRYLRVF